MLKSEIFDEYAKIATEKGLVSNAAESKELKKFRDDPYPRAGSDDISTIEALYGVKCDNSVEYQRNIMEAAHPKPIIIAPSYDKLNGLVENENERQNIMLNIVMKPTDGKLDSFKYAKKDLLLQLVRIANDMDNQNKEQLVALADACISKLDIEKKKYKSPLIKIAILPWIAGGAILLGAIWIFEHIDSPDHGLSENIDRALKALNNLETNSWYESDIDDVVKRDAEIIKSQLTKLLPVVNGFRSIMSEIQKPQALVEVQNIVSKQGRNVANSLNSFLDVVEETTPILKTAIRNFTSSSYQAEHSKQSWLGEVSSYIGEAAHGRWGLVANDFISAANALGALQVSLEDADKKAKNIGQVIDSNQEKLEEVTKEQQNLRGFENKNTPKSKYMYEEPSSNNMKTNNIADLINYRPTEQERSFFGNILK